MSAGASLAPDQSDWAFSMQLFPSFTSFFQNAFNGFLTLSVADVIKLIIGDSFTTIAATQTHSFFPQTHQGEPCSSDDPEVIVKESSTELSDHVVVASEMQDKFPLNNDGYHYVRISETV